MVDELKWFLLPVAGALSMWGGLNWKPARRFGIPICLAVTLALFGVVWYKILLCAVTLWISSTLPITLGGDSLKKWWQFAWVYFLGYLMGVGSAWLSLDGFLLALVPCGVVGTFTLLSNVRATAQFFPWKVCEFAFWPSAVYPFLLLI